MLFRSVLDRQWAMLHTGSVPAGAHAWSRLGVPALEIGRALRDESGTLTGWLRDKKATAVVVRPDGFIYAATSRGQTLPPPPPELVNPDTSTDVHPITRGVCA